ncbi:MAG: RNA polymerase-associated protein RapA [Phycisphaerae bacterium]|nr:RNA polymerase-associated protein RapA [Phycisphaerae bacterium]
MINVSQQFDLGLDTSRIKDPNDARRQTRTTEEVLQRFFHPRPGKRFELQVLADEVGMGKTFVALATAYSILAHMREGRPESDLDGCYQKVLILTPANSSLFNKWNKEVAEFVRRCVLPRYRDEATSWFTAKKVERLDELVAAVRGDTKRRVLLTNMAILRGAGGKLRHYDLKRRFMLGVLFRFWGNRLGLDERERLLKGAPADWPRDPRWLTKVEYWEQELLPFSEDELLAAVEAFNRRYGDVDSLLDVCREIARPWTWNREGKFDAKGIDNRLIRIYRWSAYQLIRQAFPLLIVDEAHNWKNGPSAGTNGFTEFAEDLAPHVRRALLLTATPFQLRPEEMLEILKVSDHIMPCPTQQESEARRKRLEDFRERTIRPVLKNSEQASKAFTKAWTRLPRKFKTEDLLDAWMMPQVEDARGKLLELADEPGVIGAGDPRFEKAITTALAGMDPDLRPVIREALGLYAFNTDLSREMGSLVIRHRRGTDHRLFRVGCESALPAARVLARPDAHLLHYAPGLDVRGDGELPHYILMRCVSEMKGGKGRSSLGSALTGCYSTLLHSAEGRDVQKRLKDSAVGRVYLDLLMNMVSEDQDADHPKLTRVVQSVLERWRAGEKVLIFCFRVNTADRLRTIIDQHIRTELNDRRRACLGGGDALRTLRARFTGRERDLIGLGLDRVLWSAMWAARARREDAGLFDPRRLRLTGDDLRGLARLSLSCGIDLRGERIDRVFLHRATECVLARRLLRDGPSVGFNHRLLEEAAQEAWVTHPYGLQSEDHVEAEGETPTQGDGAADRAGFDERGVHFVYDPRSGRSGDADALAADLEATRQRARRQGQVALLDAYAEAPSLWLGTRPSEQWAAPDERRAVSIGALHDHLWGLTEQGDGHNWTTRLMVFQALRRALLRESVLLRLLPDRAEREESGWGELLVDAFHREMLGQRESMADRVVVFVEDIRAASGDIREPGSARYAIYDATQLRDQQFVAVAKGGGGDKFIQARDRIFNGFNTPLLPEILICTTVGQEGIDLHRHCRHVIHYDLAWNPATLEQRTGRADRIGSKTFRERSLAADGAKTFLEIGVPFLAGTYDERMYEELRLRAQTFEVLTGGEFAAEHAEGDDDEGREGRLSITPLPQEMLRQLRVDLQVWRV